MYFILKCCCAGGGGGIRTKMQLHSSLPLIAVMLLSYCWCLSQGRRENLRGPGENFIRGPYDVIIFKQQD